MDNNKALDQIKQHIPAGEELIGFFVATKSISLWLFFLIGPFAALSMKTYYVAVTNRGVNFHCLSFLGKFSQQDHFAYEEIESAKIGDGSWQIPMKFKFSNGNSLKIGAQKKGMDRVAKIDAITLAYLKQNTRQDDS